MSLGASLLLVSTGSRPRRWLVVRRPEPPHEWSIPGGHIERGETPANAAVRELREETNITATAVALLGVGRERVGPVYVFLATHWRGAAWPVEGWPVSWMPWRQLRAQAMRFGGFLDGIEATYRARYGERP